MSALRQLPPLTSSYEPRLQRVCVADPLGVDLVPSPLGEAVNARDFGLVAGCAADHSVRSRLARLSVMSPHMNKESPVVPFLQPCSELPIPRALQPTVTSAALTVCNRARLGGGARANATFRLRVISGPCNARLLGGRVQLSPRLSIDTPRTRRPACRAHGTGRVGPPTSRTGACRADTANYGAN